MKIRISKSKYLPRRVWLVSCDCGWKHTTRRYHGARTVANNHWVRAHQTLNNS